MILSPDGSTLIVVNPNDILNGSLEIPSGVTSIGNYAFTGCTNLEQITIPEGVISIGKSAFWGCTKLEQITIPDSVTRIDNDPFYGCEALQTIFIDGFDKHKREALIQLLPMHLREKVVFYSESELTTLWNKELRRITNAAQTNPLYSDMSIGKIKPRLPNELLVEINRFLGCNSLSYQKALAAIEEVPLPRIQDGREAKQVYETKIKNIVDDCIEYGQPSEPNNCSFLLNVLAATAAVSAVALLVAALVAAFVFAPSISIPLAFAGVVCGAAATGAVFLSFQHPA